MSFDSGDERTEHRFFRGGELSKLLVLIGILVAGSASLAIQFWPEGQAKIPAPAVVTKTELKPIVPDTSEEFAGVKDLTETSLFDNAPKKLLLERARMLTGDELDKQAHRDVLFTHLWDRPEQYRGVPVHLEGTALRVITYEVSPTISPRGRLYEAWITTADSQRFPYCCLFEDLPAQFPIGSNVSEYVSFNGYFLKQLAYIGGDKPRGAPLLVGKLGWKSQTKGAIPGGANPQRAPFWNYTSYAIGALVVYLGIRFFMSTRRLLGIGRTSVPRRRSFATEDEPVANLDQLLANVPEEESTDSRQRDSD